MLAKDTPWKDPMDVGGRREGPERGEYDRAAIVQVHADPLRRSDDVDLVVSVEVVLEREHDADQWHVVREAHRHRQRVTRTCGHGVGSCDRGSIPRDKRPPGESPRTRAAGGWAPRQAPKRRRSAAARC